MHLIIKMGSTLTIECPECKNKSVKSSVIKDDISITTLIQPIKIFDTETQTWKTTNPNKTTSTYNCQYGHKFNICD